MISINWETYLFSYKRLNNPPILFRGAEYFQFGFPCRLPAIHFSIPYR